MKKQLLGVNITIDNKETILSEVNNYLLGKLKKTPFIIVTPNPEQLVLAQKDKEFLKLLNKADVALPDGIGIVWALRFLNQEPRTKNQEPSRISGIDFMSDLVRMANKNNWVSHCRCRMRRYLFVRRLPVVCHTSGTARKWNR